MKLIVVGSSSAGNSYILESSSEILLLEAGVRLKEVVKFLNPEKDIVGLCAGHQHSDHLGFAMHYLKRFGCTLYGNEQVVEKYKTKFDVHTMLAGNTYQIGGFRVCPFDACHDVPTLGFLIYNKECGTICFATDTYSMPSAMLNCSTYMIEANYEDSLLQENLENGSVTRFEANRLMTSHFSLDNCIKFLQESHAERAKNVVLLHLSARNSDKQMFRDRVAGALGCPTYVAQKGLEIRL